MPNLRDIIRKTFWSKDVCVYVGSDTGLREALGTETNRTLDLLDLFPRDEDLPADDSERARLLQSRLDRRLREIRDNVPLRCVLIVKNAALLARYRAGLKPFYEWFGDDAHMVVLPLTAAGDIRLPLSLDRDVRCDGNATVEYLASCLFNPKLVVREKQP